ncbi:MAG: hypothetical protein ACFB16_03100 [Phormidesmis sp.]
MKHFLRFGLIGTTVTLLLNAYAVVVLQKAAAAPLGPEWWAQWFPCYLVWFVFLSIGGKNWLRRRNLS